jgi:hypothetical protein
VQATARGRLLCCGAAVALAGGTAHQEREIVTIGIAVPVYLFSYTSLVTVLVLRGGRSDAGRIVGVASSLVLLLVGALVRTQLSGDESPWIVLAGAWLCVSLLLGTKGNPFRAMLNSADLARLRGYGIWRGEEREVGRYVRPPLQWPVILIFAVGVVIMYLVFPEWFTGTTE